MKVLVVLLAIAAVAAASIEETGEDTFPYEYIEGVEETPFIDGEIRLDSTDHFGDESPEWSLVPDGNGNFHYIDAKAQYNEPEPEPFFNAPNDVIFRLFTRRNPTAPQTITFNNAGSLTGSQFNAAHPTRFIIHGWNNDGGSPINTQIRTAYINRAEFNVITVDWGRGAHTVNYISARNRVNEVGPHLARFIDWVNQVTGTPFTRMSVIGHSLGGHTAGITGKRVTRGRLHTVVALDPALPLFSMNAPNERVAPTDAEYVEVIHTNAGLLGFDQPIGIADFYPNWGRSQPGCGIDVAGTCAHGRAFEFFAESINLARRFVSTQCASYQQILNQQCTSSGPNRLMGGDPSQHGLARGVYFVATNSNSPFARG
jgi:pimeloyl-ACP methyl ester carboxylesterase